MNLLICVQQLAE